MCSLSGRHFHKLLIFVAVILSLNAYSSSHLCELVFESCPEHFDGDTIDVPSDVVALSARIRACNMLEVEEGLTDSITPASIFFVIDESGSMWMWHDTDLEEPPRDSLGSRFLVTSALLDTLLETNPKTHVGLALFGSFLMFDPNDDSVFVEPQGYDTYNRNSVNRGAYIPLLQLDSVYTEYSNRTGYEILQQYLQTKWQYDNFPIDDQPEGYRTRNLYYQASTRALRTTATNITTGFDAAKDAMANSPHDRENQFVIFLSDGEANTPESDPEIRDRFIAGEDVPTTFTIFFSPYDRAPDQIYEMTDNIKANDYSTRNPSSDIWTIQTSFDDLMKLLFEQVISPFINVISGNPYRLEFNSIVSSPLGDREFLFAERFPLDPDITELNIDISYIVTDTRTGESEPKETNSTLYLRRSGDINTPDGFAVSCWERTSLSVEHKGIPVTVVRETMDLLELVFNQGTEEFSAIQVEVTNSEGEILDYEQINLTNQHDGTWRSSFRREIADPRPGDGVLQHKLSDSLIVTWRNPSLPLDTIRIALPFNVSRSVEVTGASYHDRTADGFIDSIYLSLDNAISYSDLQTFVSQLILPAHRNFTIDSVMIATGGVSLHVTETGRSTPRTFVTADDKIIVSSFILPDGGYVPDGIVEIQDKVAPVILRARVTSSGTLTDTLRVTFSEPLLPVHHNHPFIFRTSEGTEYTAHLFFEGATENELKFSIIELHGAAGIFRGDSIWINHLAGVGDNKNNIQSNPQNRRVNLDVRELPFSIVTRAINNPFTPEISVIPDFIRNADPESRSTGIVVIVEPEQILRPHIHLSGKASVYDVVKNPMIEDVDMIYDPESKRLFFIWDGRNRSGRAVATGNYTVIMNIRDNQGDNKSERIYTRIGVRR
ncbi:hypothetical protein CHISP_0527 [Chitinispirillum alkaliphilum]|nr:hypothetical protein CHISP_0527 [Chitinispirillum alkaliphilum]